MIWSWNSLLDRIIAEISADMQRDDWDETDPPIDVLEGEDDGEL